MRIVKKINLRYILAGLSLYYIFAYIIIAIVRIRYPYELYWMEGSILENIERVTQNKAIYTAPTIEFVPYLYMPLYYYITAFLAKVIGLGFYTGRLVSFISSIGCMILIFMFIFKETRNKIAAITGIGLFAASYNICSGYFDVARLDMLFLLFLLIGMYALKFENSISCNIISSISFALAFFTKQTALIVVIVLCAYLFIFRKRYRYLFVLMFSSLSAITCVVLNYKTAGWFYFYVFSISSKHKIQWIGFMIFIGLALLYFSVLFLFLRIIKSNYRKMLFYIALLVSTSALTLASILNISFGQNVFIPIAAVISIIFGLCVYNCPETLISMGIGDLFTGLSKNKEKWLPVLLVFQLLIMFYIPLKYIPDSKDLAAGKELENKISSLHGKVYIPAHPYLCENIGREKYTDFLPVHDMLQLERKGTGTRIEDSIRKTFSDAISKQQFDYIILDNVNWLEPFDTEIKKNYQLKECIFKDKDVFWTYCGGKRRPEYIYEKRTKTALTAPSPSDKTTAP